MTRTGWGGGDELIDRIEASYEGPVSHSEWAVAKEEGEEACWDGTRSRRHVVHVCWKRRARMLRDLMGQVQSKVSQILNKSKGDWTALSLLKVVGSRVTDQAQVEAQDSWGEIRGCSCLSCGHIPRCLCWTCQLCSALFCSTNSNASLEVGTLSCFLPVRFI